MPAAMLRFTRQLLERECECWVGSEVRSGPRGCAARIGGEPAGSNP